jgi:hypothetical protein
MSARRHALPALVALALGLAGAGAARADAPAGLSLRLARDPSPADPLGPVAVRAVVVNGSEHPVFLDSLRLERAPATGGAATLSQALPVPARVDGIAEGDSQLVSVTVTPARESERITLRFFLHGLHVPAFALADTLGIDGVDPVRLYRPRVVTLNGRATELTEVPASGLSEGGTGVLLLRDPDSRLEDDVQVAFTLARSGMSVLIVSPPGVGGSKGPADYAGPASLAAARAALDTLARMPGVSPSRLAAWGAGWGGTLALLLAEARPELRAVVAQSALADPWVAYRTSGPAFTKAFVAAAGRDSAAWKARSPFAGVTFLRSKVLVLHGEQDRVASADAMHEFVATAHRAGIEMDAVFLAQAGHEIPPLEVQHRVRRFLLVNSRGPDPAH